MSSFGSVPSKSGSMMPFRVSTDFNLGLFLKNEKSALRIAELGSVGGKVGGGGLFGTSSVSSRPYLFAQVDDYVCHEYWSLDIEFLIRSVTLTHSPSTSLPYLHPSSLSIFVPILWSTSGLYLLCLLLPTPCCTLNHSLVDASLALSVLNILTAVLTTGGLIFAKYSVDWHCKIHLLSGAIGLCLLLATLNFSAAVVGFSTDPCGLTYARALHMYDDELIGEDAAHHQPHHPQPHHNQTANGTVGGQLSTADRIINSFRYYDTKIVGLAQVFASVGQVTSAMILLVKFNDIKMYILWRLGKLDGYIEDQYSHM